MLNISILVVVLALGFANNRSHNSFEKVFKTSESYLYNMVCSGYTGCHMHYFVSCISIRYFN